MKIKLISIGKISSKAINELVADYEKRLQRFATYTAVVDTGVKNAKNMNPKEIKTREAKTINGLLDASDYVVLLDEKGKTFNSQAFSKWIEDKASYGTKQMVFIIGGAYGFDQSIYDRAQFKIRLSDMTLPHTLAKLFFTEQIYRAHTISAGHPYHND